MDVDVNGRSKSVEQRQHWMQIRIRRALYNATD